MRLYISIVFEAGNKQKHEKFKMLVLGDLNTPEVLAGSPTGSFEFPFVSFKDIVAATNNFNKSYMIGQGGFGKVYKVISHVSFFLT
jgi:hypothetical protein